MPPVTPPVTTGVGYVKVEPAIELVKGIVLDAPEQIEVVTTTPTGNGFGVVEITAVLLLVLASGWEEELIVAVLE